jgi:hypothetical protein
MADSEHSEGDNDDHGGEEQQRLPPSKKRKFRSSTDTISITIPKYNKRKLLSADDLVNIDETVQTLKRLTKNLEKTRRDHLEGPHEETRRGSYEPRRSQSEKLEIVRQLCQYGIDSKVEQGNATYGFIGHYNTKNPEDFLKDRQPDSYIASFMVHYLVI